MLAAVCDAQQCACSLSAEASVRWLKDRSIKQLNNLFAPPLPTCAAHRVCDWPGQGSASKPSVRIHCAEVVGWRFRSLVESLGEL